MQQNAHTLKVGFLYAIFRITIHFANITNSINGYDQNGIFARS